MLNSINEKKTGVQINSINSDAYKYPNKQLLKLNNTRSPSFVSMMSQSQINSNHIISFAKSRPQSAIKTART